MLFDQENHIQTSNRHSKTNDHRGSDDNASSSPRSTSPCPLKKKRKGEKKRKNNDVRGVGMSLDQLLVQYPEPQRRTVRADLVTLLSAYPSLRPSRESYVNDDGSTENVVALNGTIAILFRGASYNIPVSIYLTPQYPTAAPLCFVRPTSNMVVKPGHPIVDSNGQCGRAPLLARWVAHSRAAAAGSLLLTLVASLAEVFGTDPPLYSVQSSLQRDMLYSSGITAVAVASPPPRLAASMPVPGMAQSLRERVRRKAATALGEIGAEIEATAARQAALESHAKSIAAYRATLEQTSARYAEAVQELEKQSAAIDAALEADAADKASSPSSSTSPSTPAVDELVAPSDAASAQFLTAIAEISALEDTMFALSRGVTTENSEVVLRLIRSLARDQFLAKVLARKILATYPVTWGAPPPPYPGPR